MKYTRIYTGNDGQSHFEDVELPMKGYVSARDPSLKESMKVSDIIKATGIFFNENVSGIDWGWHTAPQRQFVILLEGKADITTSQGIKRRLSAGDILLAEDTSGKGHLSKAVGRKITKIVYVPLE